MVSQAVQMAEYPVFFSLFAPFLFGGSWDPEFCAKVADLSGARVGRYKLSKFADGELCVVLDEPLLGAHVVLLQSTSPPVNDHLMELLFMIAAANRAGASYVTAIVPYYGYARQDRRHAEGSTVSSSDVARLLHTMGLKRIIIFDAHCIRVQGFFPPGVRVDCYGAQELGVEYFKDLDNVVVVSPDAGGVARCKTFISMLQPHHGEQLVQEAYIAKCRVAANEVASMALVGHVKGKNAIIVDDIADTGGTLVKAAQALKEAGATGIYVFVTHALFSGKAMERIENSPIEKVVCTDSIKHGENITKHPKIVVLSLAPLVARLLKHL